MPHIDVVVFSKGHVYSTGTVLHNVKYHIGDSNTITSIGLDLHVKKVHTRFIILLTVSVCGAVEVAG